MHNRVILTSVSLSITLLFSVGLGSASYATQTRTMPVGDTLYAIDCDSSIGQLASINTDTAVATSIGSGSTDPNVSCAGQGALDQSTNTIYWPAWYGQPNDLAKFFKTDLITGNSVYLGVMTHGTDTTGTVGSLTQGPDGTLYAFYYTPSGSNWNYSLGTVNHANGSIIRIADLSLNGTVVSTPQSTQFGRGLWSSAYNPVDNKFYVIINNQARTNSTLYSVNINDGTLTSIGLNGDSDTWFGLAFDSQGTMWSTGDGDVKSASISTWTTSGSESRSTNGTTLNSVSWYSESNVIKWAATPSPSPSPSATATSELAETGSPDSGILMNILGVTLFTISIGVILLLVRKNFINQSK